jgi:hypothetical protein
MALHALDVLSATVTATRTYRPRGLGQWFWVTIVALFVGGTGISIPTGSGNAGGTGGGLTPDQRQELTRTVPDEAVAALSILVAVLFVLWALVILLGSLLEFPFLAWLRDGEVATWREVRAHLGQGLGLAAFRVVVGGLSLALMAGVVVATVGTNGAPIDYALAASDLAFVIGLVGVPVGVITAFTTAFVVPTMLVEDAGVLGGWRRFWGPLTGAPKQFAIYAVAVAVLATVGGLLVFVVALLALIPGLIVGGLVGLVAGVAVSGGVGVVVAAAFGGIAFTITALAGYALLQIFLRYYALFVLARVDDELDVLPERRKAVGAGRPDEDDEPVDGDGDGTDLDRDPGRDDPQYAPAVPTRRREPVG